MTIYIFKFSRNFGHLAPKKVHSSDFPSLHSPSPMEEKYIVLYQMIILPSLLINSAYNGIKMLCMYKIPTKHPSKCLQTIKSKSNSKHILNKWLLNYMSLDIFSHFAKCSIFSFFPFLFKHSLFPQKFLSVVDLSLALWRNRIKLVFPCFYRNQLTFIFFQPYSLNSEEQV